ncbi:hypothetical protein V1477_004181, partial [Vespula maculifrons]
IPSWDPSVNDGSTCRKNYDRSFVPVLVPSHTTGCTNPVDSAPGTSITIPSPSPSPSPSSSPLLHQQRQQQIVVSFYIASRFYLNELQVGSKMDSSLAKCMHDGRGIHNDPPLSSSLTLNSTTTSTTNTNTNTNTNTTKSEEERVAYIDLSLIYRFDAKI